MSIITSNLEFDGLVHHHVLDSFVCRGHAPTVDEIADQLTASGAEVRASLSRLHDGHGLLLHPDGGDVWIAHPFASAPTGTWVRDLSSDRGWWAPCIWCAMGVVALAAPDAQVRTRVGGEAEDLTIEVRCGQVITASLHAHFAIPPRLAWGNVVHWCSTVQVFRDTAAVDPWCARHRISRGEVVPLETVQALASRWYGGHLRRDWRKWTVDEAQGLFASAGLGGGFWRLPASEGRF